ncbi:MAG: ABC-F family ATP-binding cassette domain-containing protein [Candidatus Manganitrophus sp.]|nr:MAG: ABC-F family ATP-binding cassette domain-containing protein [Candidatus Manganitrophus sp.]
MNLLDLSHVSKSYGLKQVLRDVTLTVGESEKVGFVGRNGCGKTTLFRIIAGIEPPDGGEVSYKRGISIGALPQDPVLTEHWTVAEEVASALVEIHQKRDRYQTIGEAMRGATPAEMEKLLKEQQALGEWFDHHQGWQIDHRVDEVLLQLGIADRNQKIEMLSGGMRKRVALAKLVLQSPDLLLLDEPTNHLDAATTAWLEAFLIGYPGAVMLITHDRYFLDRVARRIFEIESGGVYSYLGGYLDYLEGRADRLLHESRDQGRLITLLRRESEWMRQGAKARTTKSKARIDRFYTMQEQRKDHVERDIGLRLETDQRLGHTILELDALCKSFEGRTLIRDLSLKLKAGDRIGIIGSNGAGKTTLLRMILGEELPTAGRIVRGKNTKIAYFDQKRESIDPDLKVEEALGEGDWVTVGEQRRHKTGYLADFLFEHHDQKRYIRTLSGGEKARLILAKMMLESANFLILDEPTNDLDIPTLQLFDDALVGYNGCVLMVTHDRFFLDKVATGILSFEGEGRVRYTEGNYETYLTRLKNEEALAKGEKVPSADRRDGLEKSAANGSSQKSTAPVDRKGLSFKEKKELEGIEREIEKLEARKRELEIFFADPSAHTKSAAGVTDWSNELSQIEKTLEERIARWEALESKRAG